MRANRVGAACVLDDARLVGIITERDLLRALADGLNPRVAPVSTSMTPDPRTINPDDDASEAPAMIARVQLAQHAWPGLSHSSSRPAWTTARVRLSAWSNSSSAGVPLR